MKWWLISDEDAAAIGAALDSSSHCANDYNCPDRYDGCWGCEGKEKRRQARHTLDSGLHETNAVPADFSEKE